IGMGNALVDIITTLQDDEILKSLGLPKGSMTLVDHETSNYLNSETFGLPKQKASGGSAANTIHGLAHMGIESAFVGMVGNDDLGKFFYKDLKSKNIRPILFKSIKETGRAVALISKDSERTFATYLGAAVELSIEDLNSTMFEGYDIFYLEGYLVQDHKLVEKAVRLAKHGGLKVCIDLASYNIVEEHKSFFQKIIPDVDILFANNQEAEALTGMDPESAARHLGEIAGVAVIKNGAQGSIICSDGKISNIGAIKANPVDTTGAGDMYAAGFLYGYINNQSPEICGKIGSLLAGKVIEVYGAKMDEMSWERIRREVSKMMT
ncbi:MAG: adenosine kinase, partial [Bacteroidales bacterium]